jgi:hypothetical protein
MPELQFAQSPAGRKIDELIASLDDWRGDRLAEVRQLIHEALPEVQETWKWMGSPVWEEHGIILVGNAHQTKVKLTFPHGAMLPDPDGLFNAGLTGNAWRAIDLHEQDTLDSTAFKALVREAASVNGARESQQLGSTGRRRLRKPRRARSRS